MEVFRLPGLLLAIVDAIHEKFSNAESSLLGVADRLRFLCTIRNTNVSWILHTGNKFAPNLAFRARSLDSVYPQIDLACSSFGFSSFLVPLFCPKNKKIKTKRMFPMWMVNFFYYQHKFSITRL